MTKRAILIAGSTASGKSALAIDLAKDLAKGLAKDLAKGNGGAIINTDSMQVYSVLDVLSARPQAQELCQAPHYLYGCIAPSRRYSTGEWLRDVKVLLGRLEQEQKTPIFVGGTGLYFQALQDGFVDVPPVPAPIVRRIEQMVEPMDRAARQACLARTDPEMAKKLHEPDRQRLVRALSVLEASGHSLAHWQNQKQDGLLGDYELQRIVLDPDRDVLRARIAMRFEKMLTSGAVEEVRALLALALAPDLPAMKAIGVREIGNWLAGNSTRDEAIELSVTATRQYAKRQRTWFRKRMADWDWR